MLYEIFIMCVLVCIIVLLLEENESYDVNMYNYDQENPNALKRGYIVGGSVYANSLTETPGLGWIL
jgi:hypothetical protein